MKNTTGEKRFSSADLRTFLTAVDKHLKRGATIKILGGSALLLAYEVERTTVDIDVFETNLRGLKRPLEMASQDTGLRIPVSPAGGAVGDWPWNSDERMVRVMPRLSRLQVWTLEAHDLALSKAVRGWEKDLAMVRDLHARTQLDLEILFQRYTKEMTHAIGQPQRLDDNFLALIDRLFGQSAAEETAVRLGAMRRRGKGVA